jgi:hypothetical protein
MDSRLAIREAGFGPPRREERDSRLDLVAADSTTRMAASANPAKTRGEAALTFAMLRPTASRSGCSCHILDYNIAYRFVDWRGTSIA